MRRRRNGPYADVMNGATVGSREGPQTDTKVFKEEASEVEQIQRMVVGTVAVVAIVLTIVMMAPDGAAGKPKCLTAPCPPPTNGSATPANSSVGRSVAEHSLVASGPICRTTPCPPPV